LTWIKRPSGRPSCGGGHGGAVLTDALRYHLPQPPARPTPFGSGTTPIEPRQETSLDAKLTEKIAEIRGSFEFFDKDNNGLIDFEEFRSLLRTVNPEATTSQAAEGFSMTDTNCDGYVDLDEFVAWWQATWWEY
jgi:hypothetical protein